MINAEGGGQRVVRMVSEWLKGVKNKGSGVTRFCDSLGPIQTLFVD